MIPAHIQTDMDKMILVRRQTDMVKGLLATDSKTSNTHPEKDNNAGSQKERHGNNHSTHRQTDMVTSDPETHSHGKYDPNQQTDRQGKNDSKTRIEINGE